MIITISSTVIFINTNNYETTVFKDIILHTLSLSTFIKKQTKQFLVSLLLIGTNRMSLELQKLAAAVFISKGKR